MTEQVVQKPWCYIEDGLVVYRAYSIGNCIRSMTACRNGEDAFPFNAAIRASMDASSRLETEVIKQYIAETGHDVIWRQKLVQLQVFDEDGFGDSNLDIVIRAHIDGLDQQLDEITEVKSLSDTNWNAYMSGGLSALPGYLGHKYKWQAAVQGHAAGRKVRMVIGHKEKDDNGQFYISEIYRSEPYDPEDLVPIDVIRDKIRTIEEHAEMDELPECDQNCREGDPFGEVHFFESVKQGDDELLVKLARYQELKTLLGSEEKGTGLLGEFADLKDEIKERYEPGTHVVGPFTAKVVVSKPTERIDTKALRAEEPEVAARFTKLGNPTVRLTVEGGV